MKNREPKEGLKNCVNSVLTRPKMCNQTPRHSSTKHRSKTRYYKLQSQALGLHNMGAHPGCQKEERGIQ